MNWYLMDTIAETDDFQKFFCSNCPLMGTMECPEDYTDGDCIRNEAYEEISGILDRAEDEINKILWSAEEEEPTNTLVGLAI